MEIYKFNNILKPVLWGGNKLLAFKRLPASDEPIGESWELSAMPGRESVVTGGEDDGLTLTQLVQSYGADLVGEDVYRRYGDCFPLLIKFIDAKRDLSIQVHPDDAMALRRHGCSGKNEMWYVLETDDRAIIRTGFNRELSPEEFDQRLSDGTILDAINAHEAHPDDVFFIRAGQIHNIGAGNLVVEIQQSCDITYRVWDYNRRDADGNLRQLHVEEAREALDFDAYEGWVQDKPCIAPGMTRLVKCSQFEVRHLQVNDAYTLNLPLPHSFVAVVCISGDAALEVEGMPPSTLSQGETALIPAITEQIKITGNAQFLLTHVPEE